MCSIHCLSFGFLVGFGIHHFLNDLSGMAVGVKMVGVRFGFFLCSLLAAVAPVNVFVVGEIVMLVFIEMAFGFRRHVSVFLLHFTWKFAHFKQCFTKLTN